MSDSEPQPSPEEQRRRSRQQSIQDQNMEILSRLEHREVTIRSNRYDDEDREYYVETVERTFLDGNRGYIPSVRLVNEGVRPSLQPVLKMPRQVIPVDEDEETVTLNFIYTSQPSVEHSFQYMNRYERPDLEIYITYRK